MGLRLVFGRAGSGKSTWCLQQIREELSQQTYGKPLILLVPEQATHQMEVALAAAPELGGLFRAQVLSFKRLGWRVFSETGGGQKVQIGEMGKRMLLKRILLQNRGNLRTFARSATRPGMADLLVSIIGELKMYQHTPQELEKLNVTNERLKDKLTDLSLIFAQFNTALGNTLADPDDELRLLAEKLPANSTLKGAKFWVDGFKGFTPQEFRVIETLIQIAEEVVITLPLDPAIVKVIEDKSAREVFQAGEELFFEPWQTYQKLERLALANGVEINSPVLINEIYRFNRSELKHLEQNLYAYPSQPFALGSMEDFSIRIASAFNRRAEVEGAARELRYLAREKGLHWREMAVLSRDLAGYRELIKQVFTAYEIPYFMDIKRPILHHPLIELVQSAVETVIQNWAYDPLFRCLKTDFFPLQRDQIDRLENYCLAYGIKAEAWKSAEAWDYHNAWSLGEEEECQAQELCLQQEIRHSRDRITGILNPFIETLNRSLQEGLVNVRVVTEALYDLLECLNVSQQLNQWAEDALKAGDLAEARLQQQVWEVVLNVLDEMVVSLGEENLEMQDYAQILASGLENIQLGLIPPGLDQVLVGSLERSRNPEVRVLFLLGASEGVLPARPLENGILDAAERENLEAAGFELAPKGKAQIYEEQFFIYSALTRARDLLYISYPLTDDEGKAMGASPVIERLKILFPGLQALFWGNHDKDLDIISHQRPLLQAYAQNLRTLRQGEELSPLWQVTEQWLLNNSKDQVKLKLIKSGLNYQNQERKIPKALARRLYGKRLLSSVSRLELFARCPFAHFARYGLRLRERPLYELSSPDMGQYFHALLKEFALTLKTENLEWGSLSKEQSWKIISRLSERIAPQLQNKILLSSARYRYLTNKLMRTVHNAVRVLAEHARQGVFVPVRLEVRFGPGEELSEINIPLSDGDTLVLRGQIDRIDTAVLENEVYLRILDYKSREISLPLDTIYYGLNLQLLAYLDVALQGAEVLLSEGQVATEAGFLYFPVIEPQLTEKSPLDDDQLETRRLKAVKVQGYLLANPKVIEAMDSSFVNGKSDLLGVKLNKDGSFAKGTKVLTQDKFSRLRSYLYYLLEQTGTKILDGEVELAPYRRKKANGCQYCSYKPVCSFDSNLQENRYRQLTVLPEEEVWSKVDELIKGGKDNG